MKKYPKPYKSGFEWETSKYLKKRKIKALYEPFSLKYTVPSSEHRYYPDWELPNGILVETKGKLDAATRRKMVLVKACNPDKDIRLVFQNSNNYIRKGSKTTYGAWAIKVGFIWSNKVIPDSWFKE